MQLLDGDTCPLSFFTLLHTDAHQTMVILVDIQDDRVRTFLFVAGGQRDFITAFSAQGRFLELIMISFFVQVDERVGIHALLFFRSRYTYIDFVVGFHVTPLRFAVVPGNHIRCGHLEFIALNAHRARGASLYVAFGEIVSFKSSFDTAFARKQGGCFVQYLSCIGCLLRLCRDKGKAQSYCP